MRWGNGDALIFPSSVTARTGFQNPNKNNFWEKNARLIRKRRRFKQRRGRGFESRKGLGFGFGGRWRRRAEVFLTC